MLSHAFFDFLLEKLAEYQAQAAVSPSSEIQERIGLVRQMLESSQSFEALEAATNGAYPFAALTLQLMQ